MHQPHSETEAGIFGGHPAVADLDEVLRLNSASKEGQIYGVSGDRSRGRSDQAMGRKVLYADLCFLTKRVATRKNRREGSFHQLLFVDSLRNVSKTAQTQIGFSFHDQR